jgi:hypothetical protein
MLKYFILGSCLGIALPQYVSNHNYHYLYFGLYKPHKDFFNLKKNYFKNDKGISEKDYVHYIKNIFVSFIRMVHYFLIDSRKEFLEKKQKNCFKLIENFEFVKETIENMDYVVENVTRQVIKEKILSKEQQEILEKKIKEENKTPDEFNLEYIKQIEEMSSDDYEKYLLSQSVESKENYMKNINPEFFKEKQVQRLKMFEVYENSMDEYKNSQSFDSVRDEYMNINHKLRSLTSQKSIDSFKKNPNAKNKEQLEKLEKQLGKEKSHKVKSIEQDLEELKKIFGNK